MSGVPGSALQVIAAAIEDYRVLVPPDRATPAALAEVIGEYLISSDWTITPAVPANPTGS
ncbi:hypothetical protein [Streptomyces sp. NRRL S-241]|uniref:hypothetical protein n=1 Tax=Streptomyces sp. NRRL S-241 TaxID=1463896 RepID=UPI000B2FA166|nr:hypothetical protein [Streptomyces sp. NRRL S-241]